MLCKNQVVGQLKNGRLYIHPCGQCLACRINDTRAWYVRSRFELKKLDRPFHYFLTLTYNDENLPEDNYCDKTHLKKFLNNLNTSFGLSMRYYGCSDYGSINNRAHYHAIITSTKKITQEQVERIWKKGFVYLKPLNDNNLRYVLRYTVKKKPFDNKEKGFFRLISKGWGNNVKEFYTGQEYFVFDGKKYGINPYLRQKLGLEKNDLKTYFNNTTMITYSKEYKENVPSFDKFVEQMQDLVNYRRRLK